MFGELPKVPSWRKKFDFSHLKFGWLNFGEAREICQIDQTFLLPNIAAIQCFIIKLNLSNQVTVL